jgi:hypothetical protein
MRLEWEGDPLATFTVLADRYGINIANVSRKAAKEGWSKRGLLGDLNEAANRRADAACEADGSAKAQDEAQGEAQTQLPTAIQELATRDESESVRARVLVRHRAEWAELENFRKTALAAMKDAHDKKDKSAWQLAKTSADTALANLRALSIKQDGERRAWGLDVRAEEEIVIKNPRRLTA